MSLVSYVDSLEESENQQNMRRRIRQLEDAIKALHSAKGRYHTQLATCDLFDLCGLSNTRPEKSRDQNHSRRPA